MKQYRKNTRNQANTAIFILNAVDGAAILTAKDSKLLKGYQHATGGFIEADKGHSGKYQPAGI